MLELILNGRELARFLAAGLVCFCMGIAVSRLVWLREGQRFEMRTCYAVEAIAFIALALLIAVTENLWNR